MSRLQREYRPDLTRVLFLDVDGVLNRTDGARILTPPRPRQGRWVVDVALVGMLSAWARATRTALVISSTWRLTAADARDFCARTGLMTRLLHPDWRTPGGGASRAAEIAAWMAAHPQVGAAVALDDEEWKLRDLARLCRVHAVVTDGSAGLQLADLYRCERALDAGGGRP